MVKLEEEIDDQAPIIGKRFDMEKLTRQPVDNSDDYEDASDTASNVSSDDEDGDLHPLEETLWDRFAALRDIVPLKQRTAISRATTSSYRASTSLATFAGRSIWTITTSILLLGFPLLMAFEDEQRLIGKTRESVRRD